jgi:hypothetical protein
LYPSVNAGSRREIFLDEHRLRIVVVISFVVRHPIEPSSLSVLIALVVYARIRSFARRPGGK